MFKSIRLACLFLLCATANAMAATYYVDQTAGNDASAGTQVAPWKNCPGMAAYAGAGTLLPGDTVYFDKADTWLVTGTQGLYLVGGVTYIGDTYGASGTRAVIRASGANDAGVVRFRDHATFPTVLQGFDVDGNNTVSNGIDVNHRFFQLMNGATKRIQNVIVHNITSSQNAGQYKYGIIVSNHGGTGGTVSNVEILDSVVHDVSRDGINLYPGDDDANCWISNILVRHSEAYNTGQDPNYCCGAGMLVKGDVRNATIEYSYFHNNKGAAIFINSNETNHFGTGPSNVHIRYNLVTNSTVNGAIRIYDGSGGSDPKDLKIYGNIVYNSTTNGGFLIDTDLGGSLSLLLYNNTFYNAPVIFNAFGATITALEVKNNLIYYTGGVPLSDTSGKIASHSNNVYYRGSGAVVSSNGINYTSANLATYEASAFSTNPLLKNTANVPTGWTGTYGTTLSPSPDGLTILGGSPAIGGGAALAAAYQSSVNTLGRPRGNNWDIGSYEWSGDVIAAAGCSQANVASAVASAIDGDIVTVPACGSTTWSSGIALNGKAVLIEGAGIGSTTINLSGGIVMLDATGASPGGYFWTLGGMRITGSGSANGFITPRGSMRFRVHHLAIGDVSTRAVDVVGPYGVFDHIQFTTVNGYNAIKVQGSQEGLGPSGRWSQPMNWGSIDQVYIEDSTYTATNCVNSLGVFDGSMGSRIVFRHNTATNWNGYIHGHDSADESGIQLEVYSNLFDMLANNCNIPRMIFLRGGSAYVYSNTMHLTDSYNNYSPSFFVPYYYDDASCNGSRPIDQNTPGQNGWICVQQPGSGGPNQWTSVPIYEYNNVGTGNMPANLNVSSESSHVISGRDYFNDTQRPSYTAFTYPHPYTSGVSIASTPGIPFAPTNIRVTPVWWVIPDGGALLLLLVSLLKGTAWQ